MESKRIGDVSVNDGKGLFDSEGMCDLLVSDLNNLVKELTNGQYIQFCIMITGMTQKIMNLKNGIKKDNESMKANIEELKRMNDSLVEQINGLSTKKDGAEKGSN